MPGHWWIVPNPTSLSSAFGWLVGTGPQRGMTLIFVISGLLTTFVGAGGYLFHRLREVESLTPDHDEIPLASPRLIDAPASKR